MRLSLDEEERTYLTELLFVVLANKEFLPQWIDSEKVADLLVKVNGDEEVTKDMVMFAVWQKSKRREIKSDGRNKETNERSIRRR